MGEAARGRVFDSGPTQPLPANFPPGANLMVAVFDRLFLVGPDNDGTLARIAAFSRGGEFAAWGEAVSPPGKPCGASAWKRKTPHGDVGA